MEPVEGPLAMGTSFIVRMGKTRKPVTAQLRCLDGNSLTNGCFSCVMGGPLSGLMIRQTSGAATIGPLM